MLKTTETSNWKQVHHANGCFGVPNIPVEIYFMIIFFLMKLKCCYYFDLKSKHFARPIIHLVQNGKRDTFMYTVQQS